MAVYMDEMTGELLSDAALEWQFASGELDTEGKTFEEYLEAATDWRGGTLKQMSEWRLMGMFDDLIDELNEPYEMAGMTFYPSAILKSDPIAYDQEFTYWLDSQGVSTDDI